MAEKISPPSRNDLCFARIRISSKGKLHFRDESAFAREFVVEIERVEPIVSIVDVEQAKLKFRVTSRQAIAEVKIALRKIVAGQVHGVTGVRLSEPNQLRA